MTAGIELIPDNLILRESFNIVQARVLVSEPIPFIKEFYDATMGPFKALTLASVILTDEDGTVGEAPFAIRSGAELYHKELFPELMAMKTASHDEIIKKLYWIMRNYGFRDSAGSAVSSIDLALYDIAAKRHSMPVHRLLGGKKDSCLVYGSGGGINLSDSELLAEMEELYDLSCGTVKMKIKPVPGCRRCYRVCSYCSGT
jgi:L-alanine-DL-glutamate epimerase-like enolase superfamily enzyme